MSDQGLSLIILGFDKCHQLNLKRSDNKEDVEYTEYLQLYLKNNEISENSLRELGNFLKTFQGISVLDISCCNRMNSLYNDYFFRCLWENYSLIELNMANIPLKSDSYQAVLELLENNFTIDKFYISIDNGFSNLLGKKFHEKYTRQYKIDYESAHNVYNLLKNPNIDQGNSNFLTGGYTYPLYYTDPAEDFFSFTFKYQK